MSTATQVDSASGRNKLLEPLLPALALLVAFFRELADYGEVLVKSAVATAQETNPVDRSVSRSHNIVGAAVTLGLSVIMLILMAIVAGYFVSEAPSNGAFSDAINQVESVGGTAFILLAVALLAVPVVAIVGYFMRSGLGGFITGGGMR